MPAHNSVGQDPENAQLILCLRNHLSELECIQMQTIASGGSRLKHM